MHAMSQHESVELYPGKFLVEAEHPETSATPPDLLILNQPIAHFTAFSHLWKHTAYRVCADGGANRLFDMFQGDLAEQRERYVSKSKEWSQRKLLTWAAARHSPRRP